LDPLIKSWLDVVSAHPDRYWSSPHNVADPARRRVPDKVLAATGMWMAADLAVVAEPPALSARRFAAASKRTRQAIRRSRCAPQYESIASRGVGGTNGRPSARDRTADGKMRGNALVRRASDRRLLSAFSSSHLDIVAPRIDGMMARAVKASSPAECHHRAAQRKNWKERTTPGNEEALVSEPGSNFPPEWSLSSFEKAFGRPAQAAAAPYLGQRAEPDL
jgi:hypothetical protein